MKGRLIIITFILLLISSTGAIASNNIIQIPHQVKVRGTEVKLVAIAYINGDKEFQNSIKDITLGQAPLPGYQRIIYRDQILQALQDRNVNIAQVKFNIPYQFTVIADYKDLSINELIQTGKRYIYKELPYTSNRIEIKPLNPPQKLKVPYGEINLEVEDSYQKRLMGTTTISIKVIVNGRLYRRFYLQYKINIWKKILVAKKRIERGQLLSQNLFKIKDKLISTNNSDFVSIEDSLEGKRMKVSLAASQPLLERMIELPPLVKRWTEVKVVAKVGGIEVITRGKARQSGHLGELIKVKNLSSGKTIEGRVIDKDTVQVLID